MISKISQHAKYIIEIHYVDSLVQRADYALKWINFHLAEMYCTIHLIEIYSLDSCIHPLKKPEVCCFVCGSKSPEINTWHVKLFIRQSCDTINCQKISEISKVKGNSGSNWGS